MTGAQLLSVLLLGFAVTACRHKAPASVPVIASEGPLTLPAGTALAFRTAEEIDSSDWVPTRAYAAVVSRDLKGADTQAVLPSGSPATLVLLSTSAATATAASWQLALSSVVLNGDSYLVQAVSSQSPGVQLGLFLGGVPGPLYRGAQDAPVSLPRVTVSPAIVQVTSGSLLTFRLEQAIVLVGSHR